MSIPVLPPIAASTWPTSVVGTATHGTPRRYVGRDEPREVGRTAAAESDDRAAAIEPQLAPQPLGDRTALRRLSRRQLVHRRETAPERLLRPNAVDAHDDGVGDERDGPLPGHELSEPVEGARLGVNPGGRENDTVAVHGDGIRDPDVERLPLVVETPEVALILRERTVRPTDAFPGGVDVDDHEHGARHLQELARLRVRDGATTEGEHRRVGSGEQLADCRGLGAPELRLALGREELGDRHAGALLDRLVDVEEPSPEPGRNFASERGLARAHESHEGQMSVEGRGCQVAGRG